MWIAIFACSYFFASEAIWQKFLLVDQTIRCQLVDLDQS